MIRSSSQPASRAASKLLANPRDCNCPQVERLTARIVALHALADRLEAENAELRAELEASK